jgi:hypothetical protein
MGETKVLLVEGRDEELVLPRLCESRGINFNESSIFLKQKGGYTEILKGLKTDLKSAVAEGIDTIGIVIDADDSADSRWEAICGRLKQAGYDNIPVIPDKTGTVIPADDMNDLPAVGVWLMPDNEDKGMLETLMAWLIRDRATNPIWRFAEQTTNDIYENHQPFPENRKPKAMLHTWLAWQKKPGTPMAQAITATYLDAKSPAADDFIAWIKRLFQLP